MKLPKLERIIRNISMEDRVTRGTVTSRTSDVSVHVRLNGGKSLPLTDITMEEVTRNGKPAITLFLNGRDQ